MDGLPYVLIMGDSITNGYNIPVRDLLLEIANVRMAGSAFNCDPDWKGVVRGVMDQEAKIGEKFRIIHFNWGLHAMKYVDAEGKLMTPQTGQRCIPLERYGKELERFVLELKKTEAKLIWASTTPESRMRESRTSGSMSGGWKRSMAEIM